MGEHINRLGEYNDISNCIKNIKTDMENEKPQLYTHEELLSITSKVENNIGSGGFGDVYKGRLRYGKKVAVKVLKEMTHRTNNKVVDKKFKEEQFWSEVHILGRTMHPNIVKLYGYCYDDNMKALAYEYVENGSFDKILYQKQSCIIEWAKLYDISINIAKGLSYLHENCPQIIHHDIKSDNVLLDCNHSPKISDFGLARFSTTDLNHGSQIGRTWSYAAPEVCFEWKKKINHKCDIYSFGMMLFEILMRKRIREVEDFPKKVWKHIQDGKVSDLMIECGIEEKDHEKAKKLSLVAVLCVQYIHHKRPDMSKVVKMLEGEIEPWLPREPFASDKSQHDNSSQVENTTIKEKAASPDQKGSAFYSSIIARPKKPKKKLPEVNRRVPGGENAVVVYTTSKGRRDNIEYSEAVVSILKSYPIQVDERDIVEDAYLSELQTVLGAKHVFPPVMFVKGNQLEYDKMIEMDQQGTLGSLFEGIPRR